MTEVAIASEALSKASLPPVARFTSLNRPIKHVDRIEALNIDNVWLSTSNVTVNAWHISRILRRDFYLTCSYIFFAKYRRVKNINESLIRLSEEAERLEDVARKYDVPLDKELTEGMALRIISAEAETLLDILLRVDRACSRLLSTDMREVLSDNFAPFAAEFNKLKHLVDPTRKSSHDDD